MAVGEKEAKCKDGKWKNCVCSTPPMDWENLIGPEEYEGAQHALKLFQELKSLPKIRKAKISCRNHPLSAPRNDEDSNGATSVESAIDTWCRDNDGKDVTDDIYWRWGITQLGVPNRSSFWLRASKTCDRPEKFNRWECVRALRDGMQVCDTGTETHGLAASIACNDYSIDLSGVTYGDMPPWAETPEGRKFPPPEHAAGGPNCDTYKGYTFRPLADSDLNTAIDAFCQDGKEIKGFGNLWANMFDYPPANQPQFYPDDPMHLTFGAETVNNGGPQPYDDINWCK
jgi:hypothetical protein